MSEELNNTTDVQDDVPFLLTDQEIKDITDAVHAQDTDTVHAILRDLAPVDIADLVAAGRFLRASLGAHPSAWDEAVADIGAIQAATTVMYVLQLYDDDVASGRNRIRNAGGYFRSVVRMIKAGQLDLEAELRTLRRRRMA